MLEAVEKLASKASAGFEYPILGENIVGRSVNAVRIVRPDLGSLLVESSRLVA